SKDSKVDRASGCAVSSIARQPTVDTRRRTVPFVYLVGGLGLTRRRRSYVTNCGDSEPRWLSFDRRCLDGALDSRPRASILWFEWQRQDGKGRRRGTVTSELVTILGQVPGDGCCDTFAADCFADY